MFPSLQFLYGDQEHPNTAAVQLKLLQLLSSQARQNLTFHCRNSVAHRDAGGSLKKAMILRGSNGQELRAQGNPRLRYTVTEDGCSVRLSPYLLLPPRPHPHHLSFISSTSSNQQHLTLLPPPSPFPTNTTTSVSSPTPSLPPPQHLHLHLTSYLPPQPSPSSTTAFSSSPFPSDLCFLVRRTLMANGSRPCWSIGLRAPAGFRWWTWRRWMWAEPTRSSAWTSAPCASPRRSHSARWEVEGGPGTSTTAPQQVHLKDRDCVGVGVSSDRRAELRRV